MGGARLERIWPSAWPALVWSVGAAVFFRNFLFSGFDSIIGNEGDARADIFVREHLYQFLQGKVEFASPAMFFPVQGTLGYSDAYLLDGLLYVPLRMLGADPFLSSQLLCIGLSLIGFMFFNLLLVRFAGVRQPLAAVAAAIFTFSNALYIKVGHPQLLEVYLLPLILVLFLEANRWNCLRPARTALTGLLAGLILALLFSTGYYIAWFFTFLAGITIAAFAALQNGLAWRRYFSDLRRLMPLALACGLGFAIGLIPFWHIYAPVIAQFRGRSFNDYLSDAPILRDLVNVSGANLIWGSVIDDFNIVPKEHLYSGEFVVAITPILLLAYVFCGWAVWRRRIFSAAEDRLMRNAILASFVAFAIMTVTMVKLGDWSLFWLQWNLVPGANAIRSGGRAQIVTNGIAVAVVAMVLGRALQTRIWRPAAYAIWTLVILCVAEQANVEPNHNLSREHQMALLTAAPAAPGNCQSFYISPHTSNRGNTAVQTDAMLIAQRAGIPTLNGYSGWAPPQWLLSTSTQPHYRAMAWKWAKERGITEGLCEYEFDQKQWVVLSETKALARAGAVVTPGTVLDFREHGEAMVYQGEGWATPERSGTWTDGVRALLLGKPDWPDSDLVLELTATPFLVEGRHSALAVEVVANGTVVDRWTYRYAQDQGAVVRSARIPVSVLSASPVLSIEFRIDQPGVPSALGTHPNDNRHLGLLVSRVAFLREQPPDGGPIVTPGTLVDFRIGGHALPYQADGWSPPENAGTWTNGSQATVVAELAQWSANDLVVEVTARPFLLQDRHPSLQVEVVANGTIVDQWSYHYDRDNHTVVRSARIPASLITSSNILTLELRLDQPAVPKSLGVHDTDTRALGLLVSHVSFLREGALPPNVLRPGTTLSFGAEGNGGPYRRSGWSNPEDRGTWTDGPRATMTALLSQWPAGDMILEVTAHPFLVPDQHPSLQVDVVANGQVVARWPYRYPKDKDTVDRSAHIPASLIANRPC